MASVALQRLGETAPQRGTYECVDPNLNHLQKTEVADNYR
jgi:hypothetical protein